MWIIFPSKQQMEPELFCLPSQQVLSFLKQALRTTLTWSKRSSDWWTSSVRGWQRVWTTMTRRSPEPSRGHNLMSSPRGLIKTVLAEHIYTLCCPQFQVFFSLSFLSTSLNTIFFLHAHRTLLHINTAMHRHTPVVALSLHMQHGIHGAVLPKDVHFRNTEMQRWFSYIRKVKSFNQWEDPSLSFRCTQHTYQYSAFRKGTDSFCCFVKLCSDVSHSSWPLLRSFYAVIESTRGHLNWLNIDFHPYLFTTALIRLVLLWGVGRPL